jgi:hypothetical protein
MLRRLAILSTLVMTFAACKSFAPIVAPGPSHMGKPGLQEGTPGIDRPWPTDPDKFNFIIIGDKTGGGLENWPIFDRAVEEINLQRPDFVLMVGDLIQGYTENTAVLDTQWAEFNEHAGRLELPFVPLPGNHDVSNPVMLQYWKQQLGLTHFSFDYKDCHFLFLCTDEAALGGENGFGDAQMNDVLADLSASNDAKHTFVLMHRPAWENPGLSDDWERIEEELGTRKYTVFAGHYHNLKLHHRHDHRYFVLSSTGAGLNPSEVNELGEFHHYTSVTVEDDSAHVAIIEPGNVWPPDISTEAKVEEIREAFRFEVADVADLDAAEVNLAATMVIRNTLRDTLKVKLAPATDAMGWTVVSVDSSLVTVAPGDSASIDVSYVVQTAHLAPPAELRTRIWYGESLLSDRTMPLPLDEVVEVETISELSFVGPFDTGPIDPDLVPENPRAAMPGVYAELGPEAGWDLTATYGSESLKWQTIEANERGSIDFAEILGRDDDKVVYASLSIYSPTQRNTFGMIAANDYADVAVNGISVNDNRVFQLARGREYFPIQLNPGWNTVVIKVINLGANWWLRLSVGDPAGDLRFAPKPE